MYIDRELYPFEVNIATWFSMGGKRLSSPKSEWIRGYLLMFGEGYPYKMWKEYREFAEYLGIKPGSYTSFARHIWLLKKLGLIEPVRIEPRPGGIPRTIYRVKRRMIRSPLWRRPMQALYPSTDWTKPENRKRYREKYR